MDIGDKSELNCCVAMVQDQAMIFTFRRAKTTSHPLDEAHFRFCRTRKNDAPYIPIHAHCENIDVANYFKLTAGELLSDMLALVFFGKAINVSSPNASFLKFSLDML